MNVEKHRSACAARICAVLLLACSLPGLASEDLPVVPVAEIKLNADLPEAGTPDRFAQALGLSDGRLVVLELEDFLLRSLYSDDAGQSFDTEVDVAGGPGELPVRGFRAVLNDGWLIVVLAVGNPQGGIGLSSIRSADMGRTWSPPTPIVAHGDPAHGVLWIDFRLAAGSQGTVAASFIQLPSGDLFLSVTQNAGVDWAAPLKINQQASPFWVADVAVDSNNGAVYVVYDETLLSGNGNCSGCGKPAVRRSTDAGLTLAPPVFLKPGTGTFTHSSSIHVTHDGSVLVASPELSFFGDRIDIHRSTDGAASFPSAPNAQLDVNGVFDIFAYARWNSHPADPTILVSYVNSQGQLQVRRSFNNGLSFEPAVQLTAVSAVDSPFETEHELLRTEAGAWVAVWRDSRDRSATRMDDIYMRSSGDGGASWASEQKINDTTLQPTGARQPILAAGGDDELLVVYEDSRFQRGRSTDLFARQGTAHPIVLGEDRRIDRDLGVATTDVDPAISLATDGLTHVYAAFSTNAEGLRNDVYVTTSDDAGRSFDTAVRVSTSSGGEDDSLDPQIAATADGYVYVVYFNQVPGATGLEMRFNRSANSGSTWLAQDLLLAESRPGISLSAVEGGTVHVAWAAGQSVMLATSVDGGVSFQLRDMAAGVPGSKTKPQLCSRDDTVLLAWRTTTGDLWASTSGDRGGTFTMPSPINGQLPGFASSLAIDCRADGTGVLVWDQRSQSGEEVNVSKFDGAIWSEPLALEISDAVQTVLDLRVAYTDTTGEKVLVVYNNRGSSNSIGPIYTHVSSDGGLSYSRYREVANGESRPRFGSLDLATDGLGNAWVYWREDVHGEAIPVFQRSTDGGVTFRTRMRLDGASPAGVFTTTTNRISRKAVALPYTGLFAWYGQRTSLHGDALFNADDIVDPDRDGVVALCHIPPGNPNRPCTLHLPPSAIQAHLAHGDSLGWCPPSAEPVSDVASVHLFGLPVGNGWSENRPPQNCTVDHPAHGAQSNPLHQRSVGGQRARPVDRQERRKR